MKFEGFNPEDPQKMNQNYGSNFGKPDPYMQQQGNKIKGVVIAVVAIFLVSIAVSVGVFVFSMSQFTNFANFDEGTMKDIVKNFTGEDVNFGFDSENTAVVPGDASRFDPVTSLSAVKAFSGTGSKLFSLDASYVKSDGTMDLTATNYRPLAEYKFYRETAAPEDAPPVGAGGNPEGKWYERVQVSVSRPGETRHVTQMGGNFNSEYMYTNQGMEKQVDSPTGKIPGEEIPDPKCSFADLWKVAMEKGASKDAVASIDYDGEQYEFSIPDLKVRLEFDQDCKLMGR